MGKWIFIFVGILLLPLFARSQENKTVFVAADPWPPFIDPQRSGGGLSLEIIRAAFKTQGYDVHYENIPWARSEEGVKNGKYDLLPDVWITESRKKDFMFSTPYARNEIKFIMLKEDPFEYDGITSLQGKTVGTIRGYSYSENFSNATNFTKEPVPDFVQNMKKLLLQRIDMTLDDEIVAKHRIAQENPEWFEHIRFSQTPLSREDLYVAAGYSNPRHREIIEAFNKGLEVITTNGKLADIFSSYGVQK